jgi:hypothetical protein
MKCKECGENIGFKEEFCPKCGAKVEGRKFNIPLNKEQIKETSANATKAGSKFLKNASATLSEKASDAKDAAFEMKDDITAKLTELDRMLEDAINEYNGAYTLMNDKGMQLYVQRCRAIDNINNVEVLINSIANHPKSFDTDFEEINMNRRQFTDACAFAEREVMEARKAAASAGAGLAAGASVVFMGPTAAMWIATTFGTASTGAAISTLGGAAATNAAMAWLGGGALAAGGHGIAGGEALLAMAGPIGWTIAGATLLTSIVLFAKSRTKLNKEKNEEIESVKRNIERIREMDEAILALLKQTTDIREKVSLNYLDCLRLFEGDYNSFSEEEKLKLGSMVNLTKSLSVLYQKQINQEDNE